jgi:hypothetical protein
MIGVMNDASLPTFINSLLSLQLFVHKGTAFGTDSKNKDYEICINRIVSE